MATAQSPIKVSTSTKDKIRYAATIDGCTQSDFVAKAVDEYIDRHRGDFASRLDAARTALLGGNNTTVAYMLGVSEDEIAEVAGDGD
jgi:hypothetical protein